MNNIIDDYETSPDPAACANMLKGLSLTTKAHFKDKQFQVMLLLAKYGQAKTIPNRDPLIKALLTYVLELNQNSQEEVPVICTQEFMDSFEAAKEGFLDARLEQAKRQGPASPQDKKVEWQNLCKVIGSLVYPAPFADILYAYKQEQALSLEDLAFCMLRLTELMLFTKNPPRDRDALHSERLAFLQAYLEQDPELKNSLFLIKSLLQEQYGAQFIQGDWECKLSSAECDLFALFMSHPALDPKLYAMMLKRTVECGAHELREAIVFKKVPLHRFLSNQPIDDFLDCLEKVLTGKSQRRFTQFLDDDKQAIFLLLLAATLQNNNHKSLTLLLLCLPYCIHNLRKVSLKGSLDGSEEDLQLAIRRQIGNFLAPHAQVQLASDEWPTINQVMQHVASCQVNEPILLLTRSLVYWMALCRPAAKEVAVAVRASAQFAEGLTEVGNSTQDITHHLLVELAASDANPGGLFMVQVLYCLVKMDGKNVTPKGPAWTELLEEPEIELFSSLLTSRTLASSIYNELFSHYTREGASEKCFVLALHIAPKLTFEQLKVLVEQLTTPSRVALFVRVVSSTEFSFERRRQLVGHLIHCNTQEMLLLAVSITPVLPLNDVIAYVAAVTHLVPNPFSITETHQKIIRELYKKNWVISNDYPVYTTGDSNAINLLNQVFAAVDRVWLEDELPRSRWEQKLQETIAEKIKGGRRSPSPQPNILPLVLRKSASPLLSREPPEVLVVHLQKVSAQALNKN